jgi:hypothetical protein
VLSRRIRRRRTEREPKTRRIGLCAELRGEAVNDSKKARIAHLTAGAVAPQQNLDGPAAMGQDGPIGLE